MRIAVYDDQTLCADGLASALSAVGHHVVLPCGPDQRRRALGADVYLVALNRPQDIDGIAELAAAVDPARVVLLATDATLPAADDVVAVGAWGVVSKSGSLQHVLDVLERVSSGERLVVPPDTPRPVAAWSPHRSRRRPALTDRENQVLAHLIKGHTTAHIASALGVRQSTARSHVQNVLRKLGVHSKLEAVAVALAGHRQPQSRPSQGRPAEVTAGRAWPQGRHDPRGGVAPGAA